MTRAILVFIGVTYTLSIALSALIASTGGRDSSYLGLAFGAMIVPTLGVLAARVLTGEKIGEIGWRRFPLAYLPGALLLIPLVSHAAMLPVTYMLQGSLPWVDWLTPGADGTHHTSEDRGWGNLTSGELIGRMALNAAVGVLIVSVLALFEEIGWRAWLLSRLTRPLGSIGAVWAVAAIWAFWHTPFAFSGIHNVDGVSPLQLALVAPLGHIGAGLVIGWMWLRTRSIWIAAIAHGALNNWGQLAFKYMGGSGEYDAWLLGAQGAALILTGVLLLMFAPPRIAAD